MIPSPIYMHKAGLHNLSQRTQTTIFCKTRILSGLDLESTVIDDPFPILFFDMFLDQFFGDIARADSEIAACPRMSAPDLLFHIWESR